MFGIDDALIWGPMLGAALGGVASKKDPLKGALLGAGVGLGGAGLLGAGGAGAAGMGGSLGGGIGASTAPGLSMAGSQGLMGELPVSQSLATTAGGTVGQVAAGSPGLFDSAMAYAKPLGQAANSASQVASAFNQPQEPIQPSPLMQNQPNNQLGQLVQNMGQEQQNRQQLAQQKREMRHKMIRGLV